MTAQTLQDRLRAVDPDESFPFGTENETITTCNQAADAIDTLRAEVARLRTAIEPFADVSDFLASETEGLSDDDVFNLKLAGSKFLLMTYTAKQFHDARAALAHGKADQ
jgi:hypothetical protein